PISPTGDSVDVANTLGQPGFAPAAAAVLRPEDLAEPRHAVDLIGVARMDRHPHHCRLRLDSMVEALPGLANVVGALDRTVSPSRSRAKAGVHGLVIMRRNPDIATVG